MSALFFFFLSATFVSHHNYLPSFNSGAPSFGLSADGGEFAFRKARKRGTTKALWTSLGRYDPSGRVASLFLYFFFLFFFPFPFLCVCVCVLCAPLGW